MTKKKNFYSPEFKTQAISLVRIAKRPGAEVAKELGINVNTLYNWLSPMINKSAKNHANIGFVRKPTAFLELDVIILFLQTRIDQMSSKD